MDNILYSKFHYTDEYFWLYLIFYTLANAYFENSFRDFLTYYSRKADDFFSDDSRFYLSLSIGKLKAVH